MPSNFKKYPKKPLNKNKNDINICIFYKGRTPFYLRLVSVLRHISQKPHYNIFTVYPQDYEKFRQDISNDNIFFDYVILQRDYFDFEIAYQLLEKSKYSNFKVIYEIDDDLIHMDESNPGHNYYMKIKPDLENMISKSDIVSVATVNLKKQLSHLNNNIVVIKNRLIDSWFKEINEYNRSGNTIKIGYMGSIYHSWDLILIEEAIANVKEYFSKKGISIILEVIGGTDESLDFANQIEIPQDSTDYFNFVEWFVNAVDWDIAIAPLESSNINSCKSELKYLEYAVLGIPAIYSNIGPYSQNIVNDVNGLLVYSNSPEEWTSAIIRLIENIDLQNTIRKNAIDDVEDNYRIKKSVEEWHALFESNIARDSKIKLYLKRILSRIE